MKKASVLRRRKREGRKGKKEVRKEGKKKEGKKGGKSLFASAYPGSHLTYRLVHGLLQK